MVNYWQKRCEAAERNLKTYADWHESSVLAITHSEDMAVQKNYEIWQQALKEWQQLVSLNSEQNDERIVETDAK